MPAVTVGLAELTQVAVPYVWLGAVLGISFLETPLKFRAPGITVPLGLGIGRLVFRALNIGEIVLAACLTAAVLTGESRAAHAAVVAILGSLWVLLGVQIAVLRPRLDRRARLLVSGEVPPPSHQHLLYIGLETLKVVLLPVLGIVLTLRLAAPVP